MRLRPGQLLGSDAFAEQTALVLAKQRSIAEFPRSQRLAGRPSLEALFSDVQDKTARDLRIHEARYAEFRGRNTYLEEFRESFGDAILISDVALRLSVLL